MQVAVANNLYTLTASSSSSSCKDLLLQIFQQQQQQNALALRIMFDCSEAVTDQIAVDFRITDRDMIIGGYRIPKDTPVQLPPYPMHLSSANFVQPDKFWPERWAQQMPAFSPDKGMLLCLGHFSVCSGQCLQCSVSPVFKLRVCPCTAVLVMLLSSRQHHVTGLCLFLCLVRLGLVF